HPEWIRAAGGRLSWGCQAAIGPCRSEPPLYAGIDGSRDGAGRFRESHGHGPMKGRDERTAVTVVAFAALATSGCVGRAGSDIDARPPQAVRLVTVEASDGAETTTYSAVIAPNAQVALAFRVSGYVVDVRRTKGTDGRTRAVEPGEPGTTGLVPARVRTIDYQTIVDKAQSLRDESSAGVSAAEAALAEAHAALAQAGSDFGRIAALWQQESVTRPTYDGSKARLDVARAKVDAAAA